MRSFLSSLCGRLCAFSGRSQRLAAVLLLAGFVLGVGASAAAQAGRVELPALSSGRLAAQAAAQDLGLLAADQKVSLTVTLAVGADRTAALDSYLAELTQAGSANYHRWLAPAEFAGRFGATTGQSTAARAWLVQQGFTVDAVSPAGTRMSISATAAMVDAAFGVALHGFAAQGQTYLSATAQPTLPADAAGLFTAIDGLSTVPVETASAPEFAALAAAVDTNATAILTLDAPPQATVSQAEAAEYAQLFRQAAAQGITTLARSGVAGSLPEVTAVALAGEAAPALTPFAARPQWQSVTGLPEDALRHVPDLAAPSLAAFARTLATVAQGRRLGNVNATLYALAPLAGLYTHAGPDATVWQATTGLGMVDLDELARVFPQGSTAAAVQVSASPGSPIHGSSFTLAATVGGQNGTIPTGTVTFTSTQAGFSSSTVALDATGKATSPGYLVPGGALSVTATYTGDVNYAGAAATTQFTVQPEAAAFTLAAPSTAALGSSFMATARLTSASGFGTPAASVTVTPSGILNGTAATQTLAGSGSSASASYTFTANKAGTVSLQATCTPSDQSFTCFTPQSASVAVPLATSTTALTISPTSPTAGAAVTFSATVSGVSGITPTGTVTFQDGGTALGTGSAPNATYSGVLATGATHVLTAVYAGDTNYNTSTSNTVNATVGTASTTTTLVASASTANYGQTVTISATVKGSTTVNGTQPTGTLTYSLAGPTPASGSIAVAGGTASIPLTTLTAGSYTLTSSYGGDTNYASSTGNTVSFTVTQAAATLNAQFSSTAFTNGSTSTVTATVQLPGSAQLAAGSMFTATVLNAAGSTVGTYTGTFAINAGGNSGTGAVTIPAPAAGSYTVQVTCTANTNFTCNTVSQAITSTATTTTGSAATTTVLTISPTTPVAGQTVTFTAVVSSTAATAASPITGTVTFYDGTTKLGTGTLATVGATRTATYAGTLTATTSASHSLTAVYSGDTTYAASTSAAVATTVATAPATIALSSNTSNTLAGQAVTLTASVSGVTAAGLSPTGTVAFYIAGTAARLLGTATAAPAGAGLSIATLTTTAIPAGSQSIYAVYSGDANFSSVTSSSITIGLGDYTLTFVPQSLTLTRGQTGRATAIVGIVNGFAGNITLGCTPTPNTSITCSVSPAVLVGGGSATITVVTTAPQTGALSRPQPLGGGALMGGVAMAALLGLFAPVRRRRVPVLLATLFGLGLLLNLGCGSNTVDATTTGGTPLGTTTVTVNSAGSDGTATVRHDYTLQVTIQ